jgi:alkylation response protein AidB-like acyl-CoA dehydrogenase
VTYRYSRRGGNVVPAVFAAVAPDPVHDDRELARDGHFGAAHAETLRRRAGCGSLGIARHAIDILMELAGTKIASRSRQALREDVTMQANLGRAEALAALGTGFLYEALGEAWQVVSAGQTLSLGQCAMLWLASTQAANAAKEVTELMFSAGGSASPYTSSGLERCVRDIHAAAQHITVAPANYQMAGQALLGSDMRATPLLFMDDRSAG